MFSNEEMETLNRASEILSKYAAVGGLTRTDFAHYEHMVVAIIDQYGKNGDPAKGRSKLGVEFIDSDEEKRRLLIQQLCSLLLAAHRIRKSFEKHSQENAPQTEQEVPAPLPKKPSETASPLLHITGTYTEKLPTGGELQISRNSWLIQYYFPGPDRRYNGTFVRIQGKDIDQYISAWKTNLAKYFELRKSVPGNGSFHTSGAMGMTIGVGGFWDGVSLRSYHMRVRTEQEVDKIIEDYQYAKKRASQLIQI